jgi:hypothetical protein
MFYDPKARGCLSAPNHEKRLNLVSIK